MANFTNFYKSSVVGTYSSSATTITVDDASDLTVPCQIVLFDEDYGNPLNAYNNSAAEICEVTSKSGNDLTVVRGDEGTTGITIGSGTWSIIQTITSNALDSRFYTESEVDSLLSGKADTSHTHSASDITSGTFTSARIPSLNASKITTGVFDINRIPFLSASDITSGTFADARIAESNVTQHESALTITESQISDLQNYLNNDVDTWLEDSNGGTRLRFDTGSHTQIRTFGDLYIKNGANDTLARITSSGAFADVDVPTSLLTGTLSDGTVAESNVTQHESALTITESQISDLQSYYVSGDSPNFNIVTFANHELGDFTGNGDVFYDASEGLYVSQTGGVGLLWSSQNVLTDSYITTSYDTNDVPTIGLDIDEVEKLTYTTKSSAFTFNTSEERNYEYTGASDINATIPPNSSQAFDVGTLILVKSSGAGIVTIVEGSGVTLNTDANGGITTGGQYGGIIVEKTATDTWKTWGGS